MEAYTTSPVFRSGVTLVTVDVTVLDKDGRPVPGLAADDFQIKLNGKLQPVRALSYVQVAEKAAALTIDAPTAGVLVEIAAERERQNAEWGEQNHEDGTHRARRMFADRARASCQDAAAAGDVTWLDILWKEISETFAEEDPDQLRAELVQVAAVTVAWVEAIDRRTEKDARPADSLDLDEPIVCRKPAEPIDFTHQATTPADYAEGSQL
jgi:hypothetical protein